MVSGILYFSKDFIYVLEEQSYRDRRDRGRGLPPAGLLFKWPNGLNPGPESPLASPMWVTKGSSTWVSTSAAFIDAFSGTG